MSTVTAADRASLASSFEDRAADIDDGTVSTEEGLRHLGDLGIFDLGTDGDQDGHLRDMAGLISGIAEHSMAQAFTTWAHRMVIEYLLLADRPADRSDELVALRRGDLPGATAMAAAITHTLGVGDLDITFHRDAGRIRLSGRVRWASNLFADGFLLVTAAVDAAGGHIVVAVPSTAAGLRVEPSRELLALDATASGSVVLDDVAIEPRLVLTTDLDRFLGRMRGPFLLLQSAFALGLARASLRAGSGHLTGVNTVFADRFAELGHRFATADARLEDLTGRPGRPGGHPDLRRILELRLDAALLAQDAVALEARVRGGSGYLRGSPTARRIREAAFLPIQSPTEGLLRWELTCSNS